MRFEINTHDLANAVSIAARFVERRANLPALACIVCVGEKGKLLLRATNLECGVEISVPAKVSEVGVVAVLGTVLAGFISNARGKVVSGALVGEVFKLETDHVSASIKTISTDDFPTLPRVSASTSFSVKSGDLVRVIRNTVYCASNSTVKPEMQSVLLFGDAGKLVAAATDSFRLAEKVAPLRGGGSIPQLLIPTKNANELMRIAESFTGDIEVYYNENQISTHIGNIYYTSRLIDGAFPNYRQIIPKTFTTEVVVLREDISQALRSLAIFADKFAQVTVTVDPTHKSIVLTSRNPDVGEQTTTIRATISGEGATMNFNSRYLADSLQGIAGESVRIQSNGPGKPLLIKDAADDSFFYLAMPMNR